MQRAVRWGMLAGALVLVSPLSARAGDDQAMRDAQARFEEGLKRVKAGDFEAARISFAQAYVVLHKPDILWNLALAEEKSGKAVDALGHFKAFEHDSPSETDRANAKRHIVGLMAQTGHIEVLAPAGAQLVVDGTPVGVAPLGAPIDVSPGKHRVEQRLAQGSKTAETEATAGQVAHVSFMVAEAPSHSTVAAPVPPPNMPLAQAEPQAPSPADAVPPEADRTPSKARIVTVIALGTAAVAAAAVGAGFEVGAANADTNAKALIGGSSSACVNNPSATCQQVGNLKNTYSSDQTAGDVLFVSAGALAVGAVVTWFVWKDHRSPVALAPMWSPTGLGVNMEGRF